MANEFKICDADVICGKHSAISAIKNTSRSIISIIIQNNKVLRWAISEAPEFSKMMKLDPSNQIFKILDKQNINHQGIVVKAMGNQAMTLIDFLNTSAIKNIDTIICTNGVTDCHNLGAIMRSCAAFNASALIATGNAPKPSIQLFKCAAGYAEKVSYIISKNSVSAINSIKQAGYWTYLLDGNGEEYIDHIKFANKVAFVVGSEGSGVTKSMENACDFKIKIKMEKGVESLNVSVATAIALFERSKQN